MSPIRMERLESAVRVVIAFNEDFNRHDVAGMMQHLSDDCVYDNSAPPPDGELISGKAALTRFWQGFFDQSPNARLNIEEVFGFGYRCVMRWRLERVDAAGDQNHVRGMDIIRVQDGLIHECLSYVKG
jgi:predicted SnoaL-like aldol condensation-catalyzing enzyme